MKSFFLYVLLPVMAIGGYFGNAQLQKAQVEREVNEVVYSCVKIVNSLVAQQNYWSIDSVEMVDKNLTEKVGEFIQLNSNNKALEVQSALSSCRLVAQGLATKLTQLHGPLEVYLSNRFGDLTTLNSKGELEWRLGVLREMSAIGSKVKNIDEELIQSMYEGVSASSASELVKRSYFGCINNLPRDPNKMKQIETGMAMKSLAIALEEYFTFMYDRRDSYSLNDDNAFVFSKAAHYEQFQKLVSTVGRISQDLKKIAPRPNK